MKLKIRKGATVEVITGSEKGKRGTVMAVDATKMRIKIQGIRVQSKHTKEDGIKKMEGFIHYSNAKLIDAPVAATKAKKKAGSKKVAKEKST
jgi:large subunit ribosomal protein L24